MPISIFDTRTMLQVVENTVKPKTFLKDMFFGNTRTVDTENIDVDIIKGKRRVSPFVSPIKEGQVVERLGYTTNSYKAPLTKPKMVTNAETLMKRSAGEALYSGKSPDERAAEQLARDLVELDDIITRLEEVMCAKALFEGKVRVKGDGVDELIDFHLTNKEALADGAKWSQTGATPLEDLKRMKSNILNSSAINPNVAIFGKKALELFLSNPKVLELLDLRLVETGQIDPMDLPNGATYIGRLKMPAVNIYTYEDWYIDEETGEEKALVPENMVWMGSTNARFDFVYGAYIDLKMGTMDLPRIPKSWTIEDPSSRYVQMISRPLPIPHQIDSMYILYVD